MFASYLRKEVMTRTILITVILINAMIPTVALAKPLNNAVEVKDQTSGVYKTRSVSSVENNYQFAIPERPVPSVPSVSTNNSPAMQAQSAPYLTVTDVGEISNVGGSRVIAFEI